MTAKRPLIFGHNSGTKDKFVKFFQWQAPEQSIVRYLTKKFLFALTARTFES